MDVMPKRRQVNDWFATYDNPMKAVVQKVREIVLGADPRVDECIKWQAPTFTFEGNLASFFPKSKQHASLMFHLGAQIPGKHPRLEGSSDVGRVLKIGSVEEAEQAKPEIEAIVKAWCAWRKAGEATKPKKKVANKPAKKPAAKPAKPTKKPASKAKRR
jgi:uncharacterized protein YdhG (YjbR/CyaY superfamily)